VAIAEYKFPPTLDLEISQLQTELWARVYRPADLSNGPFPLIFVLHGNHATCGGFVPPNPGRIDDNTQYTFYGTCPPTRPIVVPSHAGYEYVLERLASWGYIIVSINVDRGINAAPGFFGDAGLNLTRGRAVLRHLQRLSEWNSNPGTTPPPLGVDLFGTIDFSHVGLLGHSRGGEGARAAYNQFRDPGSPWPARIGPINFDGIFEIGPVDGQTARVLNADGTAWNVILPMCDGDVFNLQGIKPYDRMLNIRNESPATQKSTFTVWGTNHNFYNTEWQQSDSDGCAGPGNVPLFPSQVGSPQQRQVGLAAVMAFFRGNVGPGADPTFNENFDPFFDLPPVVTSVTRVDRGFTPSPDATFTKTFEDFDQPTGTNTFGFANNADGISIVHRTGMPFDDPSQRAAFISWNSPSGTAFFQTNWAAPGTGRDISGFDSLDLRVSRQCAVPDDSFCIAPSPLNPAGPTNFSVQLVMADGSLSEPQQLKDLIDLRGPVGGFFIGFGAVLHPILQTARFSLSVFSGADVTQIRGVRINFDDTPSGAIYLANVRLSSQGGLAAVASSSARLASGDAGQVDPPGPLVESQEITEGNTISIRTVSSAMALSNHPAVEIVLTSNQAFPVRDELAVLKIGNQEFNISRYPDTGETNTLIFTLTVEQFASTNDGDPIRVQYGPGEPVGVRWSFGPLNKVP
jgi:hypothetical protein